MTMNHISIALAALAVAGCASSSSQQPAMPSSAALDQQALEVIQSSFRDEGIAKLDRLQQDEAQRACSQPNPPDDAVARRIEAEQLATVQWPSDGRYLGDWKEGEKLAQSGRGMTWSDPTGGANGGSCYNCHQIGKSELSFGTIGPSLYNYGKLRGVKDPSAPESEAVVKYTWGKLWNAKAYMACSNMPRFGHVGLLKEDQLRHLMALLLDPKSPVNQ